MKRVTLIFVILVIWTLILDAFPAWCRDELPEIEWTGKLKDGTVITDADLKKILRRHEKWLKYTEIIEKAIDEGSLETARNLKRMVDSAHIIPVNLADAELRGADMAGVRLGSPFPGGFLGVADLSGADLREANLNGADLTAADLSNAKLAGAYLYNADLAGADLSGADARDATFIFADLSSCILVEADLRDARLNNANIFGADLRKANMNGSTLIGADLDGADLRRTKLFSTDLSETILQNANLSGADLRLANLTKADLRGAILLGADLTNAILDKTKFMGANGLPELQITRLLSKLESERLITYQRELMEWSAQAESESYYSQVISWLRLIFFDLTCQYGMNPVRSLIILICLIPYFAFFYIFAMAGKSQKSGIWLTLSNTCHYPTGRNRWVRLSKRFPPKPLPMGRLNKVKTQIFSWYRLVRISLIFSILSAFSAVPGNAIRRSWIMGRKVQGYRITANGWARTLSGIQCLISTYLLVLWLVTTFSNPF